MPELHEYIIEKRGDKWCLISKTTGKTLGCHPTREGAEAQERAIQAAKARRRQMAELHTIRGVEIFAAGEHNGDRYTEKDLDAMVEAFRELDFKPALKVGHAEKPGTPAYGYIDNLRRVGSKLVADFIDVPREIYEQIKRRGFDRVSAEIWWNLRRAGKVFKRVLKAVALLGAEVPAVAGLKPLREVVHDLDECERDVEMIYEQRLEVPDLDDNDDALPEDPANQTGTLSYELVRELCQDCAEKLHAMGLDSVTFQLGRMPAALRRGLCKKFGPDPGLFKRCMKSSLGGFSPADKEGFCAALHRACTGKWPADAHSIDDSEREGDDMADQAKIQEMEAQLAELSEKLKAYEQEKAEREQQLKRYEEEARKLREERRRERIEQKVSELKMPALRPYLRAVYEVLGDDELKVRFYANGKEPEERSAADVADELIAKINELTEPLLEMHSTTDGDKPAPSDDPIAEVDRRIEEYLKKHENASFEEAMRAVLDADPELKKAYADVA